MMNSKFKIGDYAIVKESKRLVKVKDMESIDDLNIYYTSDSLCYPENQLLGYHDSDEYKTIFTLTEIPVKTDSEKSVKESLLSYYSKSESERFDDFIGPYLNLFCKISARNHFSRFNFFEYLFYNH